MSDGHVPHSDPCTGSQTRSLYDIVSACLITLFACTFVSIHPNVPDCSIPKQNPFQNRVQLMLLALLAPELLVSWALRQWFVAREIAQTECLTLTHGFFLSMRGFAIRLPNGDQRPIDLNDFHMQTITSEIEFRVSSTMSHNETPVEGNYASDLPTRPIKPLLHAISQIEESDILDKSKGDALSKAVALSQVLWFIIQYGVRAASHFPATAVEVMTLAFAALNIAMYIVWWKKPLLVERPIVVRNLSREEEGPQGLRYSRYWYNPAVPAGPINSPSPNLFQKVRDTVMPEESRFLWSDRTSTDHYHQALCVSALMAMLFGALHCLAWEFSFPSSVEKILWNTSSAISTIVPLICGIQFAVRWSLVVRLDQQAPLSRIVPLLIKVSVVFYHYVLLLLALVYITARVVLLVLPFVLLRDLSPGVYCSIPWTRFLPHLST